MTRPLTVDDVAAVELALNGAFNRDSARERLPLEHAAMQQYRAGWGRPGDLGVVAEVDGAAVGAAYCRLMRGYGYVDEETPELTIAVREEARGRGVGTRLLEELAALARDHGFTRLSSASSRTTRRAGLYERAGYRGVGADEGGSVVMLREL